MFFHMPERISKKRRQNATAIRRLVHIIGAAGCLLALDAPAGQLTAALAWMETPAQDARHNAFTDLVFWKQAYYLCYRNGASHGSMDGAIVILRSADARRWTPCVTLDTLGDDRDPHFTDAGDRLLVYFGVWDLQHGAAHALPDRGAIRSHAAATRDGINWTKIQGVYEPGWWLWRTIHHGNAFYAAAYTAVRPKPPARELRLLTSPDGLDWTLCATIAKDRMPTESALWFDNTGALNLVTRMADEANEACRYVSDGDFSRWRAHFLGDIMHSPAVASWKDRLFAAGRGKSEQGWVTRLWEITPDRAVPLLTLPSGGDTAYPGLIVDPATPPDAQYPSLLISWYSQHAVPGASPHGKNTAHVHVGRILISAEAIP